ncbi:hypothetical protein ACLOAV_002945 [Pseudogymnoascus australis]
MPPEPTPEVPTIRQRIQGTRSGLSSKLAIHGALRYSVAYPTIHIRPTSPDVSEVVKSLAPSGTITIDVDGSASAPGRIELFCQHLVVFGGTTYHWPGKSVDITCRRLTFITGPEVKPGPEGKPVEGTPDPNIVIFHLSGKPGDDAPKTEEVKLKFEHELNAEAPGIFIKDQEGFFFVMGPPELLYDETKGPVRAAKAGLDAKRTEPGTRGQDAGSFNLWVDELDSPILKDPKPFLRIEAEGGNGGNGQAGGDGTKGGDGLDWSTPDDGYEFDGDSLNFLVDAFLGNKGGAGALGSPGGRGGSGGNVNIKLGKSSNAGLDKLVTSLLTAGVEGTVGKNGKTGSHGQYSHSKLYSDAKYWQYAVKNIPDADPRKIICQAIVKYWLDNNAGPEQINTPEPENLTGEALWAKFPESGQKAAQRGEQKIAVVNPSEIHSNMATDAMSLRIFLERLRFEHFLHFTSQGFLQESPADDGGFPQVPPWAKEKQELFKIDFAWMCEVVEAGNMNNMAASASFKLLRDDFLIFSLKVGASPAVDHFDNSTHFVPWTPSKTKFEQILGNLRDMQNYYDAIKADLQNNQVQRSALKDKINGANTALANSKATVTTVKKDIAEIEVSYNDVQRNLDSQVELLRSEMMKLEQEISSHVQCGVAEICETLASALMFTDAKNDVAVGGAALSVGTATVKAVYQGMTEVNGVKKDLLYSRLHYMTKTSKELKDEIGRKRTTINADQDLGKEFRQCIVANRESFEAMYKEYFEELGAPLQVVHDRFRQVLKVIDEKDKVLDEYNRNVARIAKQNLDAQVLKSAVEVYEATTGNLTDDEMQMVDIFASRGYDEIGKSAFAAIYARARAYTCAALEYTSIFNYLADLYTFNNIRFEDLQTLKMYLDTDCNSLADKWNNNRSVKIWHTMKWNEGNHKSKIKDLNEHGKVSLNIDAEAFSKGFHDRDAYDMRLYDMQVFLHGASINEAVDKEGGKESGKISSDGGGKVTAVPITQPLDNTKTPILKTGENNEIIILHVSNNGLFRYLDRDLNVISFDFSPTMSPFHYSYDQKTEEFRVESERIVGEEQYLDLGGDGKTATEHEPIPLHSPLSVWTLEGGDDAVDLSKVTEIIIKFQVSYRYSDKKEREARFEKRLAAQKRLAAELKKQQDKNKKP